THEAVCVGCEYPLRGLKTDGNCPECGHSVRESLASPINSFLVCVDCGAPLKPEWKNCLKCGLSMRASVGRPRSNPELMQQYRRAGRWVMGYGAAALLFQIVSAMTGVWAVLSCSIIFLVFAVGVRRGSLFMLELCMIAFAFEVIIVLFFGAQTLIRPGKFF